MPMLNELPTSTLNAKMSTLVIVIGGSASGKSSFIKDLLLAHNDGNSKCSLNLPTVGHGRETMTKKCKEYQTVINNQPVTLLDTPPFNAKHWKELNANYLGENSPYKNISLLFLYDISKNRLGKDMHTHMSLLNESKTNIVLLTTFWDRLANNPEGLAREEYLKSRYKIFQKAGQHLGRDVRDEFKCLPSFDRPVTIASKLLLGNFVVESIEPCSSVDPEKFLIADPHLPSGLGPDLRDTVKPKAKIIRSLVMTLFSCCRAHCISQ